MRTWLERLGRQIRPFRRRGCVEREMDMEMRFHVEMEAEELIRSGLSPDEARRRARMAFGGVERFKDEARDGRRWRWVDDLARDLHYGQRQLRAARGFTTVAVLTLAMGIGSTTVVFSMMNAVLIRPFPVPEPARVVAISRVPEGREGERSDVPAVVYRDLAAQTRSYQAVGAYRSASFTLTADGGAEYVEGGVATPELLHVIGARPLLGRLFTAEDEALPVVVLAHTMWQSNFGADTAIVGRAVELNGATRTVIGVLDAGVVLEDFQLWIPLRWTPELLADRSSTWLTVLARLQPYATLAAAEAEGRAIGARLATEHPDTDARTTLIVHSLRGKFIGVEYLRPIFLLLLGAVGFVLLITCANVASLQLARTAARRREVLLRAALGASRSRLIRQLLTESVLIALAGGAAGLLLATVGLRVVVAAIPVGLPPWITLETDWLVLTVTAGVSMLTGVIFGLAPAIGAGRVQVSDSLKAMPRRGGHHGNRLRSTLVSGQIALSLVLVVGATLLVQSFVRLSSARLGFDPTGVLAVRIALAGDRYMTAEQRAAVYAATLEHVGALAGVRSAAIVAGLPVANEHWQQRIEVDGASASDRRLSVVYSAVTGDYFRTMGVPLLAGRAPHGPETTAAGARVAVVNEAMARKLWPDSTPLGRRFRLVSLDTSVAPWYTIVGVAADAIQSDVGKPAQPHAFVTGRTHHTARILVSGSSDAVAISLAPRIRAVVARLDPTVPVFEPQLMRDMLGRLPSYWQPRLWSGLFTVFACVAMVIAAVGLFGVIAYTVRQRSHELAVRVALGAAAGDVLRLVMSRGMRLAIVGVMLGLLGAAATAQLLAGMLYGVEARDPLTFVAVAVGILCVALFASYLPARRATRTDPVVALRTE